MKTTDTLVQLHRVCGNERFLELTAQELESRVNNIKSIRITQRMRLETSQLECKYICFNLIKNLKKKYF